ncbi:MAG TPA: hypothetical protein VGE55_00645 [Limnobacter sp.]|uniref:hypothetical protein n=1 Tax=Limnobacter sp. TaxID=2003368 RepID=UPI002ED94F14
MTKLTSNLIVIISIFFAALIVHSYEEQKLKYKDTYINLCNNGCNYYFPKELHPEIFSTNKHNNTSVAIKIKTANFNGTIWINKFSSPLEYPKNFEEKDESEAASSLKIFESSIIDSVYKKNYGYFYDKQGNKTVFLLSQQTAISEKTTSDNIKILYIIPIKDFSKLQKIDGEITEILKSLKAQ